MKYPCIRIDRSKIYENAKLIVNKCKLHDIDIWGVTKVFCGHPEIAKIMQMAGVTGLADARLRNILRLKQAGLDNLVLLRIPMLSEIDAVVEHTNICLVSELITLQALEESARFHKTEQQVMLMVDVGDLREGVYYDNIEQFVNKLPELEYVNIIGIGTNLTCYGGVIPTVEILQRLVRAASVIETATNISLDIISGGNSSSLGLVLRGEMPEEINNLRIGEGIILGRDAVHAEAITHTHQDTFVIQAEIVELKRKPSIPDGPIGQDAFGNIPCFENVGWQERAIIALGKQDVFPKRLTTVNDDVGILGASSDHMLLRLPKKHSYRVGNIIEFSLDYVGVLSTMTSPYVRKVFI